MDTVTVRQLRNDVSRILRRAQAGERLIVTSNGVAVAETGPLQERPEKPTLEELIASGRVIPPRSRAAPGPAHPIVFDGPMTSEEILEEHRRDRV
jgi:antitoxin (DNA-binding transcriptional repressor) of toxin-antitoxin stability system